MPKSPAQPFELKGSLYPMTALRLTDGDTVSMAQALLEHVQRAPGFFQGAPIVIDLSQLDAIPDLGAVQQAVFDAGMRPVGVMGPQEHLKAAAEAVALPVFNGRAPKTEPDVTAPTPPKPAPKARIVEQTVRSGQQIYARDADLIVLASVNRDAEVLADGHVHIYGSLMGKAMAGVHGDDSSRIFAQALDPQLVSVAGIYSSGEHLKFDFQGRAGQVWLEGNHLRTGAL